MFTLKNKSNTITHSIVGHTFNSEPITTVERDALTGVLVGTIINNSTTNQLQRWTGATWEILSPSSAIGGLTYLGTWDANTNTPTIPAAAPANNGHYYKVAVAGSTLIDGISTWNIGDWIISNGVTWDKIEQSETVSSVNGQTGATLINLQSVLTAGDTTDRQIRLDNAVATATIGPSVNLGEYGDITFVSKDALGAYGSNMSLSMNPEEGFQVFGFGSTLGLRDSLTFTANNPSGWRTSQDTSQLTAHREHFFPDVDGVFGMSVNGILADSTGNIIVPELLTTPEIVTVSGTTATLNLALSRKFILDLRTSTGDVTISLSGLTSAYDGISVEVVVIDHALTPRTLILPAGTIGIENEGNDYQADLPGTRYAVIATFLQNDPQLGAHIYYSVVPNLG